MVHGFIMETRHYMDEKRLETWICKMADYKTIDGIIIPKRPEVFWRIKEGDLSYAKFNVKVIEYDKPGKFKKLIFHDVYITLIKR